MTEALARVRGARAAGLALLVSAGCGGQQGSRVQGHSLLEAPVVAPRSFASPATYRYHPREPAALLSEWVLPDGRVVLAGKRGERWLVNRKANGAMAASELAPEDLVAISKREPAGWLFMGRSGTAYEAEEPLSAFSRSSAPLRPLVRVSAHGGVLLGVQKGGALVRSDTEGKSWTKVGPDAVRFADVAIGMDGNGLALGIPESLFETRDAGVTWSRRPPSSFGIEGLDVDESGGITLNTVLGPRRFAPGASEPFPRANAGSGPARKLGVPPPLGPSAAALRTGRAFVSKGVYVEVRGDEGDYRLLRGALGEPLEAAPLGIAHRCAEVRLAGFGRVLYLVCARQKAPTLTQPLEIQRSNDGGRTFTVEPYGAHGRIADLSLSVGASEQLLISGVCPAAESGPGCRPAGIHRRSVVSGDAGPKTVLAEVLAPALSGPALGLLFSADGLRAYAIGRRTKGDAVSVFTSRDGALTFEAHDVDTLAAGQEDDGRGRSVDLVIETMGASEDGTVGFVVTRRGRRSLLVVDEEGRSLSVGRPPTQYAVLGVAGSRAFALDPSTRDAYESLDAGSTFVPLGRLSADPCPGSRECPAEVACTEGGCVVADLVTRVGWRPGPRSVLVPRAPDAKERPGATRTPVPLSCTLDAAEWRHLVGTTGPPGADQAALGKTAWFVLREEPTTAAVSLLSVKSGKTALEETKLFDPSPRAQGLALDASVQIEGVAALRYALPRPEDRGELREIEVVWADLLGNRSGHGVIADGGPYRPGDFGAGPGAKPASPALLSIGSGGVYVRLHREAGDDQPTYFVGRGSVETVPPVKWPDAARGRGRSEMVHVGRAHVPLRMDGGTLVRARRAPDGWAFEALTLTYRAPSEHGIEQRAEVSYLNGAAGVAVSTSDPAGRGSAFLAAFRAEGALLEAPVQVPVQADLGPSPRPCVATDRASTPRIVAPFPADMRRPVIITDPVEPMRVLVTADAVLHGTPESACVAAYEAMLVSSEAPGRPPLERALLFTDVASRSFLFRPDPRVSGPRPGFEYRTMTCRSDPSAEVPPEIREKLMTR